MHEAELEVSSASQLLVAFLFISNFLQADVANKSVLYRYHVSHENHIDNLEPLPCPFIFLE